MRMQTFYWGVILVPETDEDFDTLDQLPTSITDQLFEYYQEDMPYGVQKARTGDPYEWIFDKLETLLNHGY